MYITGEPQKPMVRIISLAALMVLLVGIGFGVAIGVDKGFFDSPSHPVFRHESPTWVPDLGAISGVDTFLITPDRAGNAALGVTLSELDSSLGSWDYEVVPEVLDGVLFEHYVVRGEQGDTLLEMVPNCQGVCRIQQITILSQYFLTVDGIHIGASYADIVTHHAISGIAYRSGVYLVETIEGIMYAIPGEYYRNGEPPETLRPGELPDDAVIAYIILQDIDF